MMNHKLLYTAVIGALLTLLTFSGDAEANHHGKKRHGDKKVIKTTTKDGVRIYGQKYFGGLPKDAPLILLFHQGGSNGRGEYKPLVPWLNKAGFRVIAWDQRTGGSRLGSENRTVAKLKADVKPGYCEAYPDLQAALDYTVKKGYAEDVIVWGSSYSAALVVQLAAKNYTTIKGVASFSPAAGGPLKSCLARDYIAQVKAPVLVMRPQSEMQRESAIQQKEIMLDAGVKFKVVADGVHGSSMLVDERTKKDMSKTRKMVAKWLKSLDS